MYFIDSVSDILHDILFIVFPANNINILERFRSK